MFKMLFHRDDGRLLGLPLHRQRRDGADSRGPGGAGPGRQARLLPHDRLQLPTLAECYKVAAHNAANKMALVRRATAMSLATTGRQVHGSVESMGRA